MTIKKIYEKKYKALLAIPFILLLISVIYLLNYNIETGSFINKGISLKGGTSLTIMDSQISEADVVDLLSYEGELNSRVLSGSGEQIGLVLEIDETDDQKVDDIKSKIMDKYDVDENDISVETMGSALGSSFFKETVKAMIFAFVFMGIVVFIYFRTPIPSTAVILAAVSDIFVTMAIVNMLGIKVGTAGIAAFLMLIGYSVDTDILLSTKVIKRKGGTVDDRIYSAMKTGMMMSLTTITAIVIALIFSQSPVITQIMQILLIGLLVDLINTWIQNAGILRWYMETKSRGARK
ncbi:protein translocase subunit SecF [Candidatus Woesearchaeota archaeon]|nr:protein translocase subunit SecF [Candidatus Woesearchaeota archaeon]